MHRTWAAGLFWRTNNSCSRENGVLGKLFSRFLHPPVKCHVGAFKAHHRPAQFCTTKILSEKCGATELGYDVDVNFFSMYKRWPAHDMNMQACEKLLYEVTTDNMAPEVTPKLLFSNEVPPHSFVFKFIKRFEGKNQAEDIGELKKNPKN